MIKRYTVRLSGDVTSISLEPEFHKILKDVADHRAISMNRLIEEIAIGPIDATNLSSKIRLFVLQHLMRKLPSAG